MTDKIIEKAIREFDKKFFDLEYKLEATKCRVPINTKEGVADLGTIIAIQLKEDIKSFLRSAITQALLQHDREIRERIEKMPFSFVDDFCNGYLTKDDILTLLEKEENDQT